MLTSIILFPSLSFSHSVCVCAIFGRQTCFFFLQNIYEKSIHAWCIAIPITIDVDAVVFFSRSQCSFSLEMLNESTIMFTQSNRDLKSLAQ